MPKTKTQGAEAARKNLPALLEDAHRGTATIITKRGAPYAAIVPCDEIQQRAGKVDVRALRGSGKGLWGRSSAAAMKKMRSEWQ